MIQLPHRRRPDSISQAESKPSAVLELSHAQQVHMLCSQQACQACMVTTQHNLALQAPWLDFGLLPCGRSRQHVLQIDNGFEDEQVKAAQHAIAAIAA